LKWKFEKLLNTTQLNVSPAWDEFTEFTAQVAKQVIQEIHCRTQDRILGSLHRNDHIEQQEVNRFRFSSHGHVLQ